MPDQGRPGPWQPRGSGLLVAVVALSIVALCAHGTVALVLLHGTLHAPVRSGGPIAAPTLTGPPPAASSTAAAPGAPSPTSASTLPGGPVASDRSPLHLDHACLVADNPPTTARIPPGDPFGSDLSDLGKGAELQRLYRVEQGRLAPADNAGPVRDCDQQLWRIVVATTPPEVLQYVDELLVFDADLRAGSDLYVGEVVAQPNSNQATSHWRLSLAPNGTDDLGVALTVAHEVGHLLSLNATQATGADEKTCQHVYLDHACLKDDSFLLSFMGLWSDEELDAWTAAYNHDDKDVRDHALQEFYDQHASSFVDFYAATYPSEDFAETFGIWCALGPNSPLLPDVIEGDPKNGAKKLAWFDRPGNPVAAAHRAGCEQLRKLIR